MKEEQDVIDVYILQNNIHYFLETVFIVKFLSGFKLTVLHQGHIRYEKTYHSLSAAKQAFTKRYPYKIYIPNIRPIWMQPPTFESIPIKGTGPRSQ